MPNVIDRLAMYLQRSKSECLENVPFEVSLSDYYMCIEGGKRKMKYLNDGNQKDFLVRAESDTVTLENGFKETLVSCKKDNCGKKAVLVHTAGMMRAGGTYKFNAIPGVDEGSHEIVLLNTFIEKFSR